MPLYLSSICKKRQNQKKKLSLFNFSWHFYTYKIYQKSRVAFYDFLNSGYLFVRQLQIQTYFYFNFSDTPCYRLHKTLPETDWYKGACAQVAKIFRCIDSALRVFGTKDAVLKKLPEICNHTSIPRNLVKRSTGEENTLSPVRL